MAMQPNSTTQVTAKAVSACRARMTGDTATTAVHPQTAVPIASSRPRRRGTARVRAIATPASSATVRQLSATGTAVTAIAVAPARVRRRPTSAIPTRSRRCIVQSSPRVAQPGTPRLFRHSMPSRTAHITGLRGNFGRPPTPSASACAMPRPSPEPTPVAARARLLRQPLIGRYDGQPDAPVHDHAVIQLGDGAAAGAHEEKRQHTVHQTGDTGEHHARAEVHRPEKVLAVTLAD